MDRTQCYLQLSYNNRNISTILFIPFQLYTTGTTKVCIYLKQHQLWLNAKTDFVRNLVLPPLEDKPSVVSLLFQN